MENPVKIGFVNQCFGFISVENPVKIGFLINFLGSFVENTVKIGFLLNFLGSFGGSLHLRALFS